MSIMTKELNSLYPDDNWYDYLLEDAVEDLKTRGIEIGIDRRVYARRNGEKREICEPAISFSGFYSQGDGLAFACAIDWAVYCATHPLFQEDMPAWYLLLVANPDYLVGGTVRSNRSNCMSISLDFNGFEDDTPQAGFFAGVEITQANGFDFFALEQWIIDDCEEEAAVLYRRLESAYDGECEYMREQEIENLKEENAEVLAPLLEHLKTLGTFCRAEIEAEIEAEELEDVVDFEDLDELALVKHEGGGVWATI